jgi:hypothetical protein
MTLEKKTRLALLFVWLAFEMSAQVTTVRRYNPSGSSTAPQTYSTDDNYRNSDATQRRAAALSKVQGTATQRTMSSKGLSPATYSTDAAPAEYSETAVPPTTLSVNGANVQRNVRAGRGQVGDRLFTPVSELYYVQFAVYCKNTPVDKAPPIDGLMLLWHEGSQCPGGEEGACYIVKGYDTAEDAKAAVLQFKSQRIDCWYNPALTGAAVEVIGVRG